MADPEQPQSRQDSTVLVAHVTVHLASGESFELLPFTDDHDVKSKVTELLDDWFRSGYLLRGGRIYPWAQVKLVEATSVDELSRRESEQRLEDWQTADLASLQKSFWKTRQQPQEKDHDNAEGQNHGSPPQPG